MPRKTTKKATKARKPAKKETKKVVAPARQIDNRIKELGDWRGAALAEVRAVIKKADPAIIEEWKWAKANSSGVPVWYHNGIVCTGETYKDKVKLTFAKGASLRGVQGLFNSSKEGNVRRALDIFEGDRIKKTELARAVKAAVARNLKSRPPK